MDKYMINENPLANGVHEIHNATQGCVDLPIDGQMLVGYFATAELAYKRARMNWPTVKVETCKKCCVVGSNE